MLNLILCTSSSKTNKQMKKNKVTIIGISIMFSEMETLKGKSHFDFLKKRKSFILCCHNKG